MAVLKTLTINGTVYQVTQVVAADSITLSASNWKAGENIHSQVVEVTGVASTTKVNLQPTLEQLEIFRQNDLTFTIANRGGVVTVYAIGDMPTNDYTIQITKTEVEGTADVIWGDSVDTPMPRSNLEQTDPTKADYIIGKERLDSKLTALEEDVSNLKSGGGGTGTRMKTFDLVAMGLPNVDVESGEIAVLEMDSTEIRDAMTNDICRFYINMTYRGLAFENVGVTVNPGNGLGTVGFMGYIIFVTFTPRGNTGTDGMAVSGHVVDMKNIPPEVTTNDDGKVLKVVDGEWVASAEEETVELPQVSADDNGKFLRVADGAWVAATVDRAEEASF